MWKASGSKYKLKLPCQCSSSSPLTKGSAVASQLSQLLKSKNMTRADTLTELSKASRYILTQPPRTIVMGNIMDRTELSQHTASLRGHDTAAWHSSKTSSSWWPYLPTLRFTVLLWWSVCPFTRGLKYLRLCPQTRRWGRSLSAVSGRSRRIWESLPPEPSSPAQPAKTGKTPSVTIELPRQPPVRRITAVFRPVASGQPSSCDDPTHLTGR